MAEQFSLARASDVPPGAVKAFVVRGREILVANAGDGHYYAADSQCPHLGTADLSRGKLEGTLIECPEHASKFDLVDGRVVRWADWTGIMAGGSRLFTAPRPLKVYKAFTENDMIFVEI